MKDLLYDNMNFDKERKVLFKMSLPEKENSNKVKSMIVY
jgi:hypothetical protein